MTEMPIGYGQTRDRMFFDGDEGRYDLWEIKFLSMLKLKKLDGIIDSTSESPDAEKNSQIFAHLVQLLDDKSLSLIITDAKNDGKKAVEILRSHYVGNTKPRIISLYTELTSLKLSPSESVTDYVLRGEKSATSLKTAGETISDSLLIAMLLKGLPDEFRAFCTVITQKEKDLTFSEFKRYLRSYAESEKCRSSSSEDRVLKSVSKLQITCFRCCRRGTGFS